MKKIVRLTESDLIRLVKRVIHEGYEDFYGGDFPKVVKATGIGIGALAIGGFMFAINNVNDVDVVTKSGEVYQAKDGDVFQGIIIGRKYTKPGKVTFTMETKNGDVVTFRTMKEPFHREIQMGSKATLKVKEDTYFWKEKFDIDED